MIAKKAAQSIKKLLWARDNCSRPVIPPPPPYVRKNPEIPVLSDYKAIPESWWDHWPKVELPTEIRTIVNVDALEARCRSAGVDEALVTKVISRLRTGAKLGAVGAGRLPARGNNLNGFYEIGERSG